jgi:Ca2+-transporting ATPase
LVLENADKTLNGDELMAMDDATPREKYGNVHFTRECFRGQTQKIIALPINNQIVATLVTVFNDGPVLKSVHIELPWEKREPK